MISTSPTATLRQAPPGPRSRERRHRGAAIGGFLLLLLAALLLLPSAAEAYNRKQKARVDAQPVKYREWLLEVDFIISDEEFESFFELEKDYQRDAFIKEFWRVRDSYQDTGTNEFKERWYERLQLVKSRYGGIDTDPARFFLLNGEPALELNVDCPILSPLLMWFYDGSDQVPIEFVLIFVKPSRMGPWRIWYPEDGLDEVTDTFLASGENIAQRGAGVLLREISIRCRDGDIVAAGLARVLAEGLNFGQLVARVDTQPAAPPGEWVATFNSYSTDLPEGAETLEADLEIHYPARRQSRTVVQTVIGVPVSEVKQASLGGHHSYNFVLTGEVVGGEELFDNFRFKFDYPAAEIQGEKIPMVFDRYLRPGEYKLVLKLEDLNSKRFFRHEETLTVPKVDSLEAAPPPADSFGARLLAEANAAISSGETTIKIVPPRGELVTGFVRFDTLSTGAGIDAVTFSLDGEAVLTKKRPPFSVELDLGSLPRVRTLAATALDSEGQEAARDELLLNAGGNRFSVDLIEPRKGKTYRGSLRAEARIEAPEGQQIERVEIFLNETRIATLYQEPWEQAVVLAEAEPMAYVRAVAYLPDGNSSEDLVFINAPDYLEEIDVQFVELYASVLDKAGRPVEGLVEADFIPTENGETQTIARFEVVDNLPIHAGILLDISASMEGSLDAARDAALKFFEQAIQPKDRGALMTFNDRPALAVKFTKDTKSLAGGLAGLKAERGTALYDSLVFSLYYFNGIKGQRALLVLSDGKDENSRFTWENTLEYARRAGVTVYTIALGDDDAHKKLSRLAEETGGQSFFIESAAELPAIYDTIQLELRSRYLIAYQSADTSDSKDFRPVELKVKRSGLKAKTIRGYYP